jgi:magnesium-transporting ATPase (P-type)
MERQFCPKGLRTILYAYKDYPLEQFMSLRNDWNNFREEAARDVLISDLTFIGLFGLKDPLRENVQASIMFADIGNI